MKKKTRRLLVIVIIVEIMCVGLIVWGLVASKSEKTPTWGKGDLPAEYLTSFGDSNGARLDYVQNQVIDKHNEILKVMAKRLLALEKGKQDHSQCDLDKNGLCLTIDGCKFSAPDEVTK